VRCHEFAAGKRCVRSKANAKKGSQTTLSVHADAVAAALKGPQRQRLKGEAVARLRRRGHVIHVGHRPAHAQVPRADTLPIKADMPALPRLPAATGTTTKRVSRLAPALPCRGARAWHFSFVHAEPTRGFPKLPLSCSNEPRTTRAPMGTTPSAPTSALTGEAAARSAKANEIPANAPQRGTRRLANTPEPPPHSPTCGIRTRCQRSRSDRERGRRNA